MFFFQIKELGERVGNLALMQIFKMPDFQSCKLNVANDFSNMMQVNVFTEAPSICLKVLQRNQYNTKFSPNLVLSNHISLLYQVTTDEDVNCNHFCYRYIMTTNQIKEPNTIFSKFLESILQWQFFHNLLNIKRLRDTKNKNQCSFYIFPVSETLH